MCFTLLKYIRSNIMEQPNLICNYNVNFSNVAMFSMH